MPFKSKSQMRFMFSQHPQLAKKWSEKYGSPKNLPEKIGKQSKYLTLLKSRKGM